MSYFRRFYLSWVFNRKLLSYRIPDIKNPRDRMVQVVKWYLSTFQAGRKSPVAKKPYNPILGEIFQCWYNVPGYQSGDQVNHYISRNIKK